MDAAREGDAMKAARMAALVLATAAASAVGCGDELSLEGRPCPCTGAWQCCEDANVCVRKASECSLFLSPNVVRLRLGASYQFQHPLVPVTWSVDELNGGSIDEKGLYRAPARPGTYHVRAMARSGLHATAIVVVGPVELKRLLGIPGGPGNVDGVGLEARFSMPASIAGDGEYLFVSDGPARYGDLSFDEAELKCFGSNFVSSCAWAESETSCMLEQLPIAPFGVRRISLATRAVTRLAGTRFVRHLALSGGQLFAASAKTFYCNFGTFGGRFVETPSLLTELVRIDRHTGELSSVAGKARAHGFLGGEPDDPYEPPQDGVGGDARFVAIHGMAANESKFIYVSDADLVQSGFLGFALRRVDTVSGEVVTLAATSGWSGSSLAVAPFKSLGALQAYDGAIYGLDDSSKVIWKYDLASGTFTQEYAWKPAYSGWEAKNRLTGFCLDYYGPMFGLVGQCIQPLVTSDLECESPVLTWAGEEPDASGPAERVMNGLWCDGKGTRYAADSMGPAVLRIAHGIAEVIAGQPQPRLPTVDEPSPSMRLNAPSTLASNTNGDVAFFSQKPGSGKSVVYRTAAGPVGVLHDAKPRPGYENLALGPDGFAYYFGEGGVRRLGLETGQDLEIASVGATIFDLVHDGVDRLYASTGCGGEKPQILEIDPASSSVEVVAEGPCGKLAVDGQKRILFAQSGNHPIGLYSIDLSTGDVEPLPMPNDDWPIALAYDPAGFLYFATPDQIRGLVVETGEILDIVGKLGSAGVQLGPLPASLNTPSGIALLPDGSLAITDSAENVLLVAQ